MHQSSNIWKQGYEIELMAPKGKSRCDLAKSMAHRLRGRFEPIFYPQSEKWEKGLTSAFETLTPGFRIVDHSGRTFGLLVDDITLRHDLNKDAAETPGWYRILSPLKENIRVARSLCDPSASLEGSLQSIAERLGTAVQVGQNHLHFVNDKEGNTLFFALPVVGERERACEFISCPLGGTWEFVEKYLQLVLDCAHELGFFVPKESATHVHFDGSALKNSVIVRKLAMNWMEEGISLKERSDTNPNCTRLGSWPQAFLNFIAEPGFEKLDWSDAAQGIRDSGIVKWCDLNLLNLVDPESEKCTVEFRYLKTSFRASEIIARSKECEQLLLKSLKN